MRAPLPLSVPRRLEPMSWLEAGTRALCGRPTTTRPVPVRGDDGAERLCGDEARLLVAMLAADGMVSGPRATAVVCADDPRSR